MSLESLPGLVLAIAYAVAGFAIYCHALRSA